jgi:hypothetical protein
MTELLQRALRRLEKAFTVSPSLSAHYASLARPARHS